MTKRGEFYNNEKQLVKILHRIDGRYPYALRSEVTYVDIDTDLEYEMYEDEFLQQF